MSRSQKELQVIEISSKSINQHQQVKKSGKTERTASQQSGKRKKKKRNGLRTFLRVLFLSAAVVVLVYVSLVGILLYRQNHPEAVDFDALKNSRAISLAGITTGVSNIEDEMLKLGERNDEAADFVENYANRQEYLGIDIDLSEDIEEGAVPLLMQWDKRWGYESFGGSNIGLAGCGPTCLSMAYLYFTGDLEGNPREIAMYCEENGFYTSEGTSWDFWTYGAEKFGLEGEELPLDENRMKSALDNGALIVCSMRPGDFTDGGHYILLRGYDTDGFYVNDPNRRSNSEKQWTYDTIKGQIKNLWALSLADNQ